MMRTGAKIIKGRLPCQSSKEEIWCNPCYPTDPIPLLSHRSLSVHASPDALQNLNWHLLILQNNYRRKFRKSISRFGHTLKRFRFLKKCFCKFSRKCETHEDGSWGWRMDLSRPRPSLVTSMSAYDDKYTPAMSSTRKFMSPHESFKVFPRGIIGIVFYWMVKPKAFPRRLNIFLDFYPNRVSMEMN